MPQREIVPNHTRICPASRDVRNRQYTRPASPQQGRKTTTHRHMTQQHHVVHTVPPQAYETLRSSPFTLYGHLEFFLVFHASRWVTWRVEQSRGEGCGPNPPSASPTLSRLREGRYQSGILLTNLGTCYRKRDPRNPRVRPCSPDLKTPATRRGSIHGPEEEKCQGQESPKTFFFFPESLAPRGNPCLPLSPSHASCCFAHTHSSPSQAPPHTPRASSPAPCPVPCPSLSVRALHRSIVGVE